MASRRKTRTGAHAPSGSASETEVAHAAAPYEVALFPYQLSRHMRGSNLRQLFGHMGVVVLLLGCRP
jgi:hypothetical protein